MFDSNFFNQSDLNEILKGLESDLDFKNNKGMNLLHLALQNYTINTPVIVKFLLEKNLSPREIDSKMKNAFDYAKVFNNIYINNLLATYDKNNDDFDLD